MHSKWGEEKKVAFSTSLPPAVSPTPPAWPRHGRAACRWGPSRRRRQRRTYLKWVDTQPSGTLTYKSEKTSQKLHTIFDERGHFCFSDLEVLFWKLGNASHSFHHSGLSSTSLLTRVGENARTHYCLSLTPPSTPPPPSLPRLWASETNTHFRHSSSFAKAVNYAESDQTAARNALIIDNKLMIDEGMRKKGGSTYICGLNRIPQ